MNEWLEQFYTDPEFRAALLAAYGPIFEQFAADIRAADGGQMNPEFVAALTNSYVDHHLDSSRAQLQTVLAEQGEEGLVQRLDEWAEKRPEKVASEETVRVSNALALDEARAAGATRKVWRAQGGDTCAYCSSLNGTTVELEQSFFNPGDVFHPEGADAPLTFNRSIGHPPAHPGCDCSVEAA